MSDVTAMAAGWRSSAVVRNGLVYTGGELLGRDGDPMTPLPIPHVTTAKQIALGEFHALILMDEQIASPSFAVKQAIDGCALEWSAPGDTEIVTLAWRPVVKPDPVPWTKAGKCPASQGHYVIEGMPHGVRCEARIEGKIFKTHIGQVTPL